MVMIGKPAALDQSAREAQAVQQKAAEHKEAEAQRITEEAECRKSLDCWSMKHSVAAIMKCQDNIEKLAPHQAEWTDGYREAKFSHSQWKSADRGIVTYSGDKIKIQNGFGAWTVYTYECDYDTEHATALAVRAQPERLS